jgi:hypothetical protein
MLRLNLLSQPHCLQQHYPLYQLHRLHRRHYLYLVQNRYHLHFLALEL